MNCGEWCLTGEQDDGVPAARQPGDEGEGVRWSACDRRTPTKGPGTVGVRGRVPRALRAEVRLLTGFPVLPSPPQSVKDMPVIQDGPPPGGFPAVRYARRLPNSGPGGVTLFGIAAAVMAYGMYQVGQANHARRQERDEKLANRLALVPYLQAEEDRRCVGRGVGEVHGNSPAGREPPRQQLHPACMRLSIEPLHSVAPPLSQVGQGPQRVCGRRGEDHEGREWAKGGVGGFAAQCP